MATNALNVTLFIQKFSLPVSIAKGLITSEDDCEEFYQDFYGRNRFVADDLLDYREYRIQNSKINLDMFLYMCYDIGMKDAFELTFFQSFDSEDILVINLAILKKKTTLEKLYEDFQKNPNKNILQNVL